MSIIKKIFKTKSQREIKKVLHIVKEINDLEEDMEALSNADLAAKTPYFKQLLEEGSTLDDILPEAFAVVREAAKRVLEMRHYDVQLIGGIMQHQGRITEMKTGEGKTLVATLPAYLNALTGKGVHIVTVNEYLAKRDSEWMGKIFTFLGLTVGTNLNRMNNEEKKIEYKKDILYSTNNELGFDYLRDNMVVDADDIVQRELYYAIIDEIDSILVDEARTPLIISGRGTKSNDVYKKADDFVKTLIKKEVIEEKAKGFLDVSAITDAQQEDLSKYDYIVDLKAKTASLTEKGIKKAEQYFNIENYNDLENSELVHHVTQAIQAHGTMRRDIDYIVKDGEALIVDEFTGRIMHGRRYSNGLHQAIEAKEGIKIEDESQTLATITFQNYFRLYTKLAGMTGTAMTEKEEFEQIYDLDVIEIPTNMPVIRKDNSDIIYKTEESKFNAVLEDVKSSHEKGQPVLVGTASVETSERLAAMFNKAGLPHQVLNAKHHEREAEIIAQAGQPGVITIATNMAGRGTDIKLGGNSEFLAKQQMKKEGKTEEEILNATSYFETDDEEILADREEFKQLKKKFNKENEEDKKRVIEAGGLKIVGTERHDARRIDNQLRGRSGRQGDPGETVFYLSLEDKLMKVFGGDMVTRLYDTLDIPENLPIQVGIISRAIENAQKRIEGLNFSARKYTLNYDDVINVQRQLIYNQRRQVLNGENIHDQILNMVKTAIEMLINTYREELETGTYNYEMFEREIINNFAIDPSKYLKDEKGNKLEKIDLDILTDQITDEVIQNIELAHSEHPEEYEEIERYILLRVVDDSWIEHIDTMDDLKNGIGLRGYGQRDPVVQYRIEGSELFDEMNAQIKLQFTKMLTHVKKVEEQDTQKKKTVQITSASQEDLKLPGEPQMNNPQTEKPEPIVNTSKKVGRNDPCTCGSGKKYKQCCGK